VDEAASACSVASTTADKAAEVRSSAWMEGKAPVRLASIGIPPERAAAKGANKADASAADVRTRLREADGFASVATVELWIVRVAAAWLVKEVRVEEIAAEMLVEATSPPRLARRETRGAADVAA